jgi:hypothetical protein
MGVVEPPVDGCCMDASPVALAALEASCAQAGRMSEMIAASRITVLIPPPQKTIALDRIQLKNTTVVCIWVRGGFDPESIPIAYDP